MAFNNDDYQPQTGKIIKSDGSVVNRADGVNGDGSENIVSIGRNVGYQRILVNQPVSANGNIFAVVDFVKLGTKAINIVYSCTAVAYVTVYPCDANGNKLTTGTPYGSSNATGYTTNQLIISELGGARYVAIFIYDKSGAINTCNFVDVFNTFS